MAVLHRELRDATFLIMKLEFLRKGLQVGKSGWTIEGQLRI